MSATICSYDYQGLYLATRDAKQTVTVTRTDTGARVTGKVGQDTYKGSRAAKARYIVVVEFTKEDGSIGSFVHGLYSGITTAESEARSEARDRDGRVVIIQIEEVAA